jgi:hypothetical protein
MPKAKDQRFLDRRLKEPSFELIKPHTTEVTIVRKTIYKNRDGEKIAGRS